MIGEGQRKRKRSPSITFELPPRLKAHITSSDNIYQAAYAVRGDHHAKRPADSSPESQTPTKRICSHQQFTTTNTEMDTKKKVSSKPKELKPCKQDGKVSKNGTDPSFEMQGPPMEGTQEFNSYSFWKYPLPEIDIAKELSMVQ